jgi:hypothetical protein
MQRGTRRTVARAALLTGGALAAVLVAGCQGASSATGAGAGTIDASDAAVSTTATAQAPPVIATGTTGTTDTATQGTAPAQAAGGAPAAKSSALPECKANDLKLGVGQGDGAAGHTIVPLTFTNVSGTTCAMQGWPGVSFVTGDAGTQVGAPAARMAAKGPQVNLAPGNVASALVQAANPGVYGGGCSPTSVRGFRVYAPDDTAAMFVPYQTTGCGNPSTIQLQVQTVKPGAGGA